MDVATKEAIGNISLRNNGIAQSNKHCVLKFDSHQISCAKKKKKVQCATIQMQRALQIQRLYR